MGYHNPENVSGANNLMEHWSVTHNVPRDTRIERPEDWNSDLVDVIVCYLDFQ